MEENKMESFSRLFRVLPLFLMFSFLAFSQTITPDDITIDCGGVLLKGKFYVAEKEGISPTVILLQGFPGNETDVLGLGKKISKAGFNVLTFNYSGTYQSQGEWSFENTLKNIRAAYDFLHQPWNISKYKIDTTFIYLGGWSYGGGMALTYAVDHPEILSVFSVAGTDHGEFFIEYTQIPEMKKEVDAMFAELITPKGPVRFAKGALPYEIAESGIEKQIPALFLRKSASLLAQRDILLIGGWDDKMVSIDQNMLPLYRALKAAKAERIRIAAFQDGHAFTNSREEVAQTLIEWLKTVSERKKTK